MLSFITSHPLRTRTAHLQTIQLDNGASIASFRARSNWATGFPSPILVAVNRLPPASTTTEFETADKTSYEHNTGSTKEKSPAGLRYLRTSATSKLPGPSNSSLGPPLHYHLHQDETFVVTKGRAAFYTCDFEERAWFQGMTVPSSLNCKSVVVGTGQSVKIPKGIVHTFRNASSREELELEFLLDPPLKFSAAGPESVHGLGDVEEAFFRNTWSYRNDCSSADMPRSLLQVLCFNWRGGVVLMLPGCGTWISWLLGMVGAFVGRWIWGYRTVYDEYFTPDKKKM